MLLVYEKMSPIARQRFIPAEEFLDVARVYLERVKQVWRWQNENGTEGRQAFRDCDVVKAFPPYRYTIICNVLLAKHYNLVSNKLIRINFLREEITKLTLCSGEGLTLETSSSESNRKVTTKG